MKSVIIKNYLKVFDEYEGVGVITPGDLLELTSAGKVQRASEEGGTILPMFATEDELQGKGITQNYAAEDVIQCWIPQRGDVVNAILKQGETVAIGDYLVSKGDGTLKKYVAQAVSGESGFDSGVSIPDNKVVGQALTAPNASAGNVRIKVRII